VSEHDQRPRGRPYQCRLHRRFQIYPGMGGRRSTAALCQKSGGKYPYHNLMVCLGQQTPNVRNPCQYQRVLKGGSERTVIFPIKLDEDVVPYFYDIRIVPINEVGRVSPPNSIEMNLAEVGQYSKFDRESSHPLTYMDRMDQLHPLLYINELAIYKQIF